MESTKHQSLVYGYFEKLLNGKSIPLFPSAFFVPTSFRRHSNQFPIPRPASNDTGTKMEVRTKGTKMRKGLTVARFGLGASIVLLGLISDAQEYTY